MKLQLTTKGYKFYLNNGNVPKGYNVVIPHGITHPSNNLRFGVLLQHATTNLYVYHCGGVNVSINQHTAQQLVDEYNSIKNQIADTPAETKEVKKAWEEFAEYAKTARRTEKLKEKEKCIN